MQAVAAGRRDHRDDGAGLPRRHPGNRPGRRLRQGQPDPRRRRYPQRHHGGSTRRARGRGVQRAAARRGPPAGVPDDHRRKRRGAADPLGRRHRDPVGGHGDPGRAPDASAIADVLPRHLLRRGQTPQSFRLSTIRAAYANAAQDPNFTATDDCTVVLRYLPDVPIAVVAGHERNMKVTEPIDVYIADKLFQLTSADTPAGAVRRGLPGQARRQDAGGLRRFVRHRRRHRRPGRRATARRSGPSPDPRTGTHVERRSDVAESPREVLAETGQVDFVVNTAGSLPRGELAETSEETIYSATDVNYLAPIFIAQEFFPHLAASEWVAAAVHFVVLHPRPVGLLALLLGQGCGGQSDPGPGRRVVDRRGAGELRQPGADRHPDATKAFGEEPAGTLLSSDEVARSPSTCCSPVRPATSSTSAARRPRRPRQRLNSPTRPAPLRPSSV